MRFQEVLQERSVRQIVDLGLMSVGSAKEAEQILEDGTKKLQIKKIGQGRYARVYSGYITANQKVVVKLGLRRNDGWLYYGRLAEKYKRNKHFPKIYYMQEFQDGYLAVIEYLDIGNDKLLKKVMKISQWSSNQTVEDACNDLQVLISDWAKFNQLHNKLSRFINCFDEDMEELIHELKAISKNGYLDLHEENWGVRNNQDLVLTDPIIEMFY